MAKVLLVIGDAAEVLDTFYPLHRLREEGYRVDVAGPAKRVYHLVLHERAEGLTRLRVMRLSDGAIHTVDQPEPVHTVGPGMNPEFVAQGSQANRTRPEREVADARPCTGIPLLRRGKRICYLTPAAEPAAVRRT